MATNLAIDDALIETARELGNHRTKKAAVIRALETYIAQQQQAKVLALFGTVDFDADYDHKRERRRRPDLSP